MKVKMVMDLNRLFQSNSARNAFERYFTHFPPNDKKLRKELNIDQATLDSMLAYMVKKTILEDDGKLESVGIVGLPPEQREAGR